MNRKIFGSFMLWREVTAALLISISISNLPNILIVSSINRGICSYLVKSANISRAYLEMDFKIFFYLQKF
jgi:hypothetical protein